MAKQTRSLKYFLVSSFWMAVGTLLVALSLELFLIPNKIIDGGIIGIAMIGAQLFGQQFFPAFFVLLNLPFVYLAWRNLGKSFVTQMLIAILFFIGFISALHHFAPWHFEGDMLEVIVIGGLLLGIGVGLIIRVGGCLDGTEISAILLNKRYGYSVGQVVLIFNIFIFCLSGLAFGDWHPPIYSFMTFIVAIQLIDKVIVGMDETKSVMIMSERSKKIADAIIHELGLGLTVMYGRGGFSKEDCEILYVIAERLQLQGVKDVAYREDPHAFIAIENLHEVSFGTPQTKTGKPGKRKPKRLFIPRVKH
jgi:uncharacterized membrane-anchored protein YitT (DUF2179 family)